MEAAGAIAIAVIGIAAVGWLVVRPLMAAVKDLPPRQGQQPTGPGRLDPDRSGNGK